MHDADVINFHFPGRVARRGLLLEAMRREIQQRSRVGAMRVSMGDKTRLADHEIDFLVQVSRLAGELGLPLHIRGARPYARVQLTFAGLGHLLEGEAVHATRPEA